VSKKTWIIFAVIVVVVLGGLVVYSRSVNPPIDVSNVDTNSIIAASDQNGNIADHVEGSANAKVTLIEYGDFQCPYCGEAYAPLRTVISTYGDKIAFVFRNFPLTTIHPNARAAAGVAEAAGLQGKYWEMHDLLYKNQSAWTDVSTTERDSVFKNFAEQLGMDINKYNADLSNGAKVVNKKIAFDQALAKKIDVSATPTFYLNGTKLTDQQAGSLQQGDTSVLDGLINDQLKKAGVDLPDSQK
jgi:protein-disulfide isomerase